MAKSKIENQLYEGFGFPVMLLNVPLRQILNEWVLDIDLNRLQEALLRALVSKPVPLTGAELRFIRKFLELTTSDFGKHLGVTHTAVLKWESDKAAINPTTEKCLRLNILDRLHAKDQEFRKAYLNINIAMLAKHRKEKSGPVILEMNLSSLFK
jgi:DNA-binding transcriptional regulator YiaG